MKRSVLIALILLLCVPAVGAQDGDPTWAELVLLPDPLPGPDDTAYRADVERVVGRQLEIAGYDPFEMTWSDDARLHVTLRVGSNETALSDVLMLFERPPQLPAVVFEFVDFSAVPYAIYQEGDCILTTAQVAYAESLLAEGERPLAYSDYICDDGSLALLQDGEPFVTVMTGVGIAEANAEPHETIENLWLVPFTLAENNAEADSFVDYIANNGNRQIGIVVYGYLISAPTITPEFADRARTGLVDGGVITGNLTGDKAQALAAQLSSLNTVGPIRVTPWSITYLE